MKAKPLPLTDAMVDAVARRFRLLGEPIRLRLLQKLQDGERSVNQLVKEMEGNQPNISRHLTALHEGGILTRRREGSSIYYSIGDPLVFRLCDLVCQSTMEQVRLTLGALNGSGRN